MLYETRLTILPEWIDENGHMNVAYYVLAFDLATDTVYKDWFGDNYTTRGFSAFTLGMNVDYVGELLEGDTVRITTQLMDWDKKRLHYFHEMYNAETGTLAARNECLSIGVNLETRRSAPFPQPVQVRLTEVFAAHQALPTPEGFGRKLGIRRKSLSGHPARKLRDDKITLWRILVSHG